MNLLENAVKFSPRGGTVHLSLSSHRSRPPHLAIHQWESVTGRTGEDAGGAVLITVRDMGPGIPDPEKSLIFERFFQAESGKKVHRRGVGLGLTICREIITAHQGAIWVDDAPGGGSIFSLLLPWADVDHPKDKLLVPPDSLPERQRLGV